MTWEKETGPLYHTHSEGDFVWFQKILGKRFNRFVCIYIQHFGMRYTPCTHILEVEFVIYTQTNS